MVQAYRLSDAFPDHERFHLTKQLRRAAHSVATNIVEGSKRRTNPDFAHFLNVAESSAAEARYHLQTAILLGYVGGPEADLLVSEFFQIGLMLAALRRRILKD